MISEYIVYSIIGAIIFPLIYYFSLNKKYKICALIPAIPLVGLTGLFFIIQNKGNINGYILNHCKFLSITISMYVILIITYHFIKNILFSIFIALMIWLSIVYYNFYN